MMTKKQNMVTDDYVSLEIAKLLKEKGFPQTFCDKDTTSYDEVIKADLFVPTLQSTMM